MTDKIEQDAEEFIEKIDSLGGMARAIEHGYVQREIQKSAYRFNQEMEAGKRIVVGVNKFKTDDPPVEGLHEVDLKLQEDQIAFLNKVRSERNNEAVQSKLAALKTAAQGDDNLMPYILDAVRDYASVGEICDTLREVFGEYEDTVTV